MTTTNTFTSSTLINPEVATLARQVLHVVAVSSIASEHKAFGLLAATMAVSEIAAQASPELRARLAQAAVLLVRSLAPEIVIDLPAQDVAH